MIMLAERVVQPAINAEHLAYCPSMDLIAFATIDDLVHVHQLNGQKVFGVSGKQSMGSVRSIKWKPNGRCNKWLDQLRDIVKTKDTKNLSRSNHCGSFPEEYTAID